MEYSTNSLELGMTSDFVDISSEVLALRSTASHNAIEWIVLLIGKREQMPCLIEHVGLVDVGLQMHRLHHVQSFCSREIIGHLERTVQCWKPVEPRVTKEVQIPEVLVCVYDLHSWLTGGNLTANEGDVKSICLQDLFHICPPFALGSCFERLLHAHHNVPPFLSLWIGRY